MAEEKPPKLSVLMTFPRVKDFARDSNGDVLPRSLSGPDYIEAENQWTREKLIAIEEAKILRERVRWCYRREGVNHLENCKDVVKAYMDKIDTPNYGMVKGPSKHF